MGTKRARLQPEKQERKKEILFSAEKLFLDSNGELNKISVDSIVKGSGISKGTFYLYFKTKEEVYLDLLEDKFVEWFESMKKGFRELGRNPDPEKIADVLIKYVTEHNYFIKLLVISNLIIEKNIESERLFQYKIKLLKLVQELGEVVESRVTTIEIGEGSILLMRSYGIVLGVWQVVDVPESTKNLFDNGLSFFQMDYKNELKKTMINFWKGSI